MLLYNGDCREVIKTFEDNSVQLIVLDPPYGHLLKNAWDTNNDVFDLDLVKQCFRVLKPTGSTYVWCGIGEKSNSLMDFHARLSTEFIFKDLITWKKRRGIGMRRGWLYTREEILWFVKTKDFTWNKDHQYGQEPNSFSKGMGGTKVAPFKRITNVWTDIPEELVKAPGSHPAAKPIAALKRIILAHTQPGDIVADFFMGGGSTGVAALELGRDFIGVENNGPYFLAAEERLMAAE